VTNHDGEAERMTEEQKGVISTRRPLVMSKRDIKYYELRVRDSKLYANVHDSDKNIIVEMD
jgi:hypothetical protein